MGKYNFKVVEPNSGALARAGFDRVSHLPFILDSRPGIHRDGSEYLVDRGLGVWDRTHQEVEGRRPTGTSIRNYASWLCQFLEWCEARSVDPMQASYADHVTGRFQSELTSGLWGKTGRRLSDSTVNKYVDTATDFLQWMAWKGKRQPFVVPYVTRASRPQQINSSVARQAISARQGRIRESPCELQIPTDTEVDTWLASVYAQKGQTFGLMCETVLMSAARRQEVVCWRTDTLPLDPHDWLIVNPTVEMKHQLVSVRLRFGTKGRDFGSDHGDKVGPERSIKIPLHLAQKLHTYRQTVRPRLLQKWVSKVRGLQAQRARLTDSVHLFLDPTGTRQSGSGFYNAWKAGVLPYPAWSPHLGRHWWACSTLMSEIRAARASGESEYEGSGTLTAILMTAIIRMKIVPQLGHISSSTTMRYVRWICDQFDEALPERYQAAMLDEPGDCV